MVIDTNNINSSGGAVSTRSRNAAPVVPTTKAPPSAVETAEASTKDNVVLSPEAQNLTRLQNKMGSLPDVNYDRVAAIKQAIAEGRFEINPERIAENMLNQDDLLA